MENIEFVVIQRQNIINVMDYLLKGTSYTKEDLSHYTQICKEHLPENLHKVVLLDILDKIIYVAMHKGNKSITVTAEVLLKNIIDLNCKLSVSDMNLFKAVLYDLLNESSDPQESIDTLWIVYDYDFAAAQNAIIKYWFFRQLQSRIDNLFIVNIDKSRELLQYGSAISAEHKKIKDDLAEYGMSLWCA